MIVAAALMLGLALVALLGGDFARLASVRMPGLTAVVSLFVVQGLARGRLGIHVSNADSALLVWSLSSVALVAMLWRARSLPGVPLIALGLTGNLLVVLMNSGMPVDAPLGRAAQQGFYHQLGSADYLPMLADVLPAPSGVLLSAGDVLMIVGATVVLVGCSLGESPRVSRRPHRLRGWGHGQTNALPDRST